MTRKLCTSATCDANVKREENGGVGGGGERESGGGGGVRQCVTADKEKSSHSQCGAFLRIISLSPFSSSVFTPLPELAPRDVRQSNW